MQKSELKLTPVSYAKLTLTPNLFFSLIALLIISLQLRNPSK